ncbi:MAG TPA: CinA family nicotinamide mononucleotide deamidase-related protein [Acidimicrobiia bacterium]|nr:CinA family nicotinamide mononucleotide deamidase-related protein [Acidimicrobiia bacterium]
MIVEVIAVGTELLIGQIVNSNAALIATRLAEQGLDAHFQVTVGDNLGRLCDAIRNALGRSDSVILTGGIGPTQDDLTREAICQVTGRTMTRDAAHAAWIEDRLRSQGRAVPESVLRMADLPEGALSLPNANGVALGVALDHHGKWLFALPGVPVEMIAMLDGEVLPRLRQAFGSGGVLRSRLLRIWGMGESEVSDRLDDMFGAANPSVAFLIKDMEVQVRISAKAPDIETADLLIEPVEEEVKRRLGETVFGLDDDTVESQILASLTAQGWTLGTIEQATLGQVGARIAAIDRERTVFAGTVIPGSPSAKVTAPVADVVLRVGAAGEDKTSGRRTTRPVKITVTTPEQTTTRVFEFGGDDERLRSFSTIAGLHQIRVTVPAPRGRF